MCSDPRILIHVQLVEANEASDYGEQSTVLRLDVLPDTEFFGVRRSERLNDFTIEPQRITFSGQNRKAGSLFRALEPGGELRKHVADVHRAWTTDEKGLVSACRRVSDALKKLPEAEWR